MQKKEPEVEQDGGVAMKKKQIAVPYFVIENLSGNLQNKNSLEQ